MFTSPSRNRSGLQNLWRPASAGPQVRLKADATSILQRGSFQGRQVRGQVVNVRVLVFHQQVRVPLQRIRHLHLGNVAVTQPGERFARLVADRDVEVGQADEHAGERFTRRQRDGGSSRGARDGG